MLFFQATTCLLTITVAVSFSHAASIYTPYSYVSMKCSYGERGSLTATCYNATSNYFKVTPYKFDNLDETVRCNNCNLSSLEPGTFDISGNHIITLDLSKSNISIIRAKAFLGLMYLKNLLMPHNFIRSIYPGTFDGIKAIEYLDLQNNSIGVLVEGAFKELVQLVELNLKKNQIMRIEAKAFIGLSNLQQLYLEDNKIVNMTGAFADNLTQLSILNLRGNMIRKLTEKDFANLTRLNELVLAKNFISEIQPNVFDLLASLEILDLSYNPIVSLLPGSFQGLKNLEDLDMSHTFIREMVPKTWQGLFKLRNLDLSNNRLMEFQTKMYSALPELSRLNLSFNEISSVEKTGIFSLTLHSLDLSHNNITSFDYLLLLEHIPKLSFFNLEQNPLHCPLRNSIKMYFEEEDMGYILHLDNDCVATSSHDYVYSKRIQEVMREPGTNVNFILIYLLLVIMITMIVTLFYAQFRLYQMYRASNGRERYASQAQLISSNDLQTRDSDYLRD